jgi:hypothetical protein
MTVRGRAVTVIVQRDGVLKAATYRIPLWILRAALLLAVILAVVLGLGVAFYAPIVRQASRVPGLESERRRVVPPNAGSLTHPAAIYCVKPKNPRLRQMVGAV